MRISDWSSDVCSSDLRSGIGITDAQKPRWQLLEGDYLLPRNTAKAIEILTELSGRGDNLASRKLASLYFTGKNDGGGAVLRDYDKYIFRSGEHTSELQSLMRISYAVFCLKKKQN